MALAAAADSMVLMRRVRIVMMGSRCVEVEDPCTTGAGGSRFTPGR
jgi:hypothetical protein